MRPSCRHARTHPVNVMGMDGWPCKLHINYERNRILLAHHLHHTGRRRVFGVVILICWPFKPIITHRFILSATLDCTGRPVEGGGSVFGGGCVGRARHGWVKAKEVVANQGCGCRCGAIDGNGGCAKSRGRRRRRRRGRQHNHE